MSKFRHHPDGIIYLGDLELSLAEFRIEEPIYKHLLFDGISQFSGPLPWPDGDRYLANEATYAANREARLNPPPTLDQLKVAKIRELRLACKAANEAGFFSHALDGVTPYKYSTDNSFGDSSFDGIDQMFLIASHSKAVANLNVVGWTVRFPAKGPADTAYRVYEHTAAQMIKVGEDGFAMIQTNRAVLRDKLVLVTSATTVAQVQAITW